MIARTLKALCAVCLLASLVVSTAGCGSGIGGCASDEDLKQIEAEKAWDKSIKESRAADKAAADKAAAEKLAAQPPADGTVMKSVDRPEGEPVLIWKAGNDGGIEGMNGASPVVYQDATYFVTEVCTYHSDGSGNNMGPAGTIALKADDGTMYGPWQATLRSDVYWIVNPDQDLPAGNYTVIDSNPATWAQNSGSNGLGMGWAYGIPVK
jgi:hypothetical protein